MILLIAICLILLAVGFSAGAFIAIVVVYVFGVTAWTVIFVVFYISVLRENVFWFGASIALIVLHTFHLLPI